MDLQGESSIAMFEPSISGDSKHITLLGVANSMVLEIGFVWPTDGLRRFCGISMDFNGFQWISCDTPVAPQDFLNSNGMGWWPLSQAARFVGYRMVPKVQEASLPAGLLKHG